MVLLKEGETLSGCDSDITAGGLQLTGKYL